MFHKMTDENQLLLVFIIAAFLVIETMIGAVTLDEIIATIYGTCEGTS